MNRIPSGSKVVDPHWRDRACSPWWPLVPGECVLFLGETRTICHQKLQCYIWHLKRFHPRTSVTTVTNKSTTLGKINHVSHGGGHWHVSHLNVIPGFPIEIPVKESRRLFCWFLSMCHVSCVRSGQTPCHVSYAKTVNHQDTRIHVLPCHVMFWLVILFTTRQLYVGWVGRQTDVWSHTWPNHCVMCHVPKQSTTQAMYILCLECINSVTHWTCTFWHDNQKARSSLVLEYH